MGVAMTDVVPPASVGCRLGKSKVFKGGTEQGPYMPLSNASDDATIFEQVASALTVKSICGPFEMDIPAGSTVSDISELFSARDPKLDREGPYREGRYRVVAPDGSTKGIVSYSHLCSLGKRTEDEETEDEETEDDEPDYDEPDYDETETIDGIMDQLEPRDLVSSATTILEAVELFGRTTQTYFCVIHANEIIGILCYEDLFKPLGRLAFLALALEIEDLALSLCCSANTRGHAWNVLPGGRKQKVIDLFEQRYKRSPSLPDFSVKVPEDFRRVRPAAIFYDVAALICCTNLIDKANMIWKLKLIESGSRSEVLSFFNELKEIRDRCAHPTQEWQQGLIARDRLARFVTTAVRIRAEMAKGRLGSRWELAPLVIE